MTPCTLWGPQTGRDPNGSLGIYLPFTYPFTSNYLAVRVPELEIGLSPAILRPNKANKAKLSSVSECLHSEVSLVRGGKTRLTRLNSGVGILEQLVGGWVTRLNYCGRHAGKI